MPDPHPSRARLHGFCITILASVLPLSVSAEWLYDASAGLNYNDNLSNASQGNDTEDDISAEGNVSLGQYWQATNRVSVSVAALLKGVRQINFTGLDHVSAGVTAALRVKSGLGTDAPWLKISGSALRDEYRSDPRDGWHYKLSMAAGKQLGNRLDLHVVFAYEQHDADQVVDIPMVVSKYGIHGDAFNTRGLSITAGGVYTITNQLALLVDYTRRTGAVTSTVRPYIEIFEYSDAITLDTGFGAGRVAYRIDADTDIFSAGLSRALGSHASLNANYTRQESHGDGDFSYDNNIFNIGILYVY